MMFANFSDFMKLGSYNYCQIETNEDEYTFVTKDGGFLTVFEIHGTNKITTHEALNEKHEILSDRLKGALSSEGRRLQFVFSKDPNQSKRQISQAIKPIKATMKNLELDLGPMIDERERVLASKTSQESCFLVVQTLVNNISKHAHKRALKERDKRSAGVGQRPGRYGQSPFLKIQELHTSHNSFVNNIKSTLTQTGVNLTKLDCHTALREIRKEISPELTSENWRPSLLGDKLAIRSQKEVSTPDISHLMQPHIGMQLFCQEPTHPLGDNGVDRSLVKIGKRIYAPLCVDIGPQDPKPFSDLFLNIERDMPWRYSIVIETGSDGIKSKLATKKSFSSFLKFTNSGNPMIQEACDGLLNLCDNGHTLVNVYMSFATWGNDVNTAIQNKSRLIETVQGWGYTEVIEEKGDTFEALFNTLPGFSDEIISNKLPMTLDDALYMTPYTRPASPWKKGSMLFRTLDDKLFPYLPGSSKQATWVDLVFAPPGYGKSFFLAASNMSLILAPGNKIIPRIAIIDIGFSSASFVEMVKNALPKNKRHLAESFKVEMDPSRFMVNPFDTPLGCNKALAIDREWLVNFLTLLLTPASEKEGIPRLGDIVGLLVDSMYQYYSEDGSPKTFDFGMVPKVDEALHLHSINIGNEDSWYKVRDELFKAGALVEAGIAQRHALPNLNDATEVLSNRNDIKDMYGNAVHKGEPLLDYVSSAIVAAIRAYPILSGPSIFDTGAARVVSMDLSSVAKGGSDEADKKTGIMYMLARQMLCKEFYRNDSTLIEIPHLYKKYHEKAFEEESMSPKKICMDEFHRTRNVKQVRQQVVADIREGRKFDCHVSLLSQSIDDFDDEMVEFATNIYVLSKGITEDTMSKINNKFKPSSDAKRALRLHVNGPEGAEGSSMLYLGSIKGTSNNRVEHPIRLTLGPMELWAYSTTHEDVLIRKKMTDHIGLGKSLEILSKEFPSGIKTYIEAEKLKDSGNAYSQEEYDDSLYNKIVIKMVKKHRKI
jgi:intracellular multiplication protein IcmB